MEGEVTVNAMDAVITSMGSVIDFAGTILTEITENPILLFIFAAGLVPIGFRVLKGLKRTAIKRIDSVRLYKTVLSLS